jgi:hypothetical protein
MGVLDLRCARPVTGRLRELVAVDDDDADRVRGGRRRREQASDAAAEDDDGADPMVLVGHGSSFGRFGSS